MKNICSIFILVGLFIITLLPVKNVSAQPFIDIVQLKYVSSPDAGLHKPESIQNSFQYYNGQLNLPWIFKKDSSMLLFNPSLENWQIKMSSTTDLPENIHSLALPLYFVKPLSAKWSVTITPTLRWNGYGPALLKKEFMQFGGVALMSYKKKENLYYRFGLYYNSEFSGPFFMPLLGIDWQISKKNSLFGVLPGNLTYEHKVAKNFYYGATFRAITNSYVAGLHNSNGEKRYVRIDENQLGIYADTYLSKNIVLTAEAGHSVYRRIRLGEIASKANYYAKEKARDNLYFSLTLAYRMRFR